MSGSVFRTLALFAGLVAGLAEARIVSYAPVTSRMAIPAVQRRASRHYALVELDGPINVLPAIAVYGSVVLYDSAGEKEPRRVIPGGAITVAALYESPEGVPYLFAGTTASLLGDNRAGKHRYLLSTDGGDSWTVVPLPAGAEYQTFEATVTLTGAAEGSFDEDSGGPVARGRRSPIRIGNEDVPFVFTLPRSGATYAIAKDGSARVVFAHPFAGDPTGSAAARTTLLGSDATGTRFLAVAPMDESGRMAVYAFDTTGSAPPRFVTTLAGLAPKAEGWITPAGGIYLETEIVTPSGMDGPTTTPRVLRYFPPTGSFDVTVTIGSSSARQFAVPTADFSGAWVVRRGPSLPTMLSRHDPTAGLVEFWKDASAPDVEAIHAAAGGTKLLVQVHRPRPQPDERLLKDPALAVWTVGDPAPQRYDELFLEERNAKGFVHLDVEAVANGEPFVFDSGTLFVAPPSCGPCGGDAGGGADVTQEWGVVRGSLRQALVIPAVARTAGAFGAFWRTDLLVSNPDADPVDVVVALLPQADGLSPVTREATLTLAPTEIRAVPDVLATLFELNSGAGALSLTPSAGRSVSATSRTYAVGTNGSYGMTIGAVDSGTAFTTGFPATFAAALLGDGFRTNVVVANLGPRPAAASMKLVGESSIAGAPEIEVAAEPGTQAQRSSLSLLSGAGASSTAALRYTPTAGESVPALIAIDNRTNDATYFPPDLTAQGARFIPAIVHQDGASGARFRTDLFLFNPLSSTAFVRLEAKVWTEAAVRVSTLQLRPNEARVVRDALATLFGTSGVARLRYVTSIFGGERDGVRVTSRTYTAEPDGGTYGLLIPPLNAFQSAGPGDALEILGAVGQPGFRTNLSLVELSPVSPTASAARARVEIVNESGRTLDVFEVTVGTASGVQIDDLFGVRGLGNGPPAALIRVRPVSGVFGAYATSIDRGTNDPAYLPASLTSRP